MSDTRWYDWLWVALLVYLLLPLYNILFAWFGLVFMVAPVVISVFMGSKAYCNKYCGRGQLYQLLGGTLKVSRDAGPPRFLRSRWFRYGFLLFFSVKFGLLLYGSYAAAQASGEASLSWLFDRPASLAESGLVPTLVVQLASGLYWVMLASTVLGILTMLFFKPRSWCVYCPMGTITQEICRFRHGEESQ